MPQKHWSVIINPRSGNFNIQKDFDEINKLFISKGIHADFTLTKHKKHAESIAAELLSKGLTKIAVVGGDGTLNEVVNGIFTSGVPVPSDMTLAMIPVGTGNDWCRTFGIPSDFSKAIELIALGKTIRQDIGKIYFENGKTNYFINVAGVGFDAEVVKKVNNDQIKNRRGKLVYLKNLVLCLIKSKSQHMKNEFDNKILDAEVFSIAIGIGKHNGGGMMPLPNAIVDDGLFDITVIKKISKLDVIIQTKNLFDGTFITHKSVECHRAKYIKLQSTEQVLVEADGESLGKCPCILEIIPKALNVVTGN